MTRVAIDARSMQDRPLAGVGRLIASVLPHIAERVDVELLTASERPPIRSGYPEHPLPTPWPHVASAWLQWSAPRWLKDFNGVFHCPWYWLPFRRTTPSVVTLHDLTFERHPEWSPRGRAQATSYVVQARWAARTAAAIVTPSYCVADDVVATYRVPSDRIFVAIPAADKVFAPDIDGSEVLPRLGVSRPYVVALGGHPRRQLEVALAAWRLQRDEHGIGLVVAGPEDLAPEPGLVVGRFNDQDWAALMSNASALLYPTAYEGFGLPAIEAAASGTPVICAKVGALPEVLGDAALWCESPTVVPIAANLGRLLRDGNLSADLRAAGLDRASHYSSWEACAESHVTAYSFAALNGNR